MTVVDRGDVETELKRARSLLWKQPLCRMPLQRFLVVYQQYFDATPNMALLTSDMENIVTVCPGKSLISQEDGKIETAETMVELSELHTFARDLVSLLKQSGGRIALSNFDNAYVKNFGVTCKPSKFGFASIVALIQSLHDLVMIRGRGFKKFIIMVNNNSDDLFCPVESSSPNHSEEISQEIIDDLKFLHLKNSYDSTNASSDAYGSESLATECMDPSNSVHISRAHSEMVDSISPLDFETSIDSINTNLSSPIDTSESNEVATSSDYSDSYLHQKIDVLEDKETVKLEVINSFPIGSENRKDSNFQLSENCSTVGISKESNCDTNLNTMLSKSSRVFPIQSSNNGVDYSHTESNFSRTESNFSRTPRRSFPFKNSTRLKEKKLGYYSNARIDSTPTNRDHR